MKVCSKCKIEKNKNEFHKDKYNKDGLQFSCILCNKIARKLPKKQKEIKIIIEGKKQCSKCKEFKEYSDFYKRSSRKTGYSSQCKYCISIYKDYVKDDKKEYDRQNWINNKDTRKQQAKLYRILNKEKIKNHDKERYPLRKEAQLKKRAIDKLNNPEKYKQISKNYRNKHAIYNTYANKLTIEEEPILAEDGISLKVKCRYCKNYFMPLNGAVIRRIQTINGDFSGENNLYCSQKCKDLCSVYGTNTNSYLVINDNKDLPYTQSELNIWAETVKTNNKSGLCEVCGINIATDAHHELPKKTHPQYALDITNGIAVCEECHNKLHTGACSTGRLANMPCKLK